jgi:hypothetical protein
MESLIFPSSLQVRRMSTPICFRSSIGLSDLNPELSKLAEQRPSGRRKLLNVLKRMRASEIGLVAVVAVLFIRLHPSQGEPPPLKFVIPPVPACRGTGALAQRRDLLRLANEINGLSHIHEFLKAINILSNVQAIH